jgi:3-methylfumaryl-CoA hydratase
MTVELEDIKQHIGKSETATDVVTASVMLKFAATLGLATAPSKKGEPVPPGWHGGFFPPSHRPDRMREDGQESGSGLIPDVPLPRRRIGGTRMMFHEPLRVGDEIERISEIADVRIDGKPDALMVTVVERSSISSGRGLAVVEERDRLFLSEARAEATPKSAPEVPGSSKWERVVEPKAALLFRFSAIRFNSHRIHYDRDYVTGVEKLPGLVVQTSLISQLLIEMCRRELPKSTLTAFDFTTIRQTYDTGPFTIAGNPDGDNAALWAIDPGGNISVIANAAFA